MGYLPETTLDPSCAALAVLRENYGFVPGLFRAQGSLPRLVEAEVALANAILYRHTAVSRIEKECLVLAEAAARGNAYCAALQWQTLLLLGAPAERLTDLISGTDLAASAATFDHTLALAWTGFACTLAMGLGVPPDFAPPPLPSRNKATAAGRGIYTSENTAPVDGPAFDFLREAFGFVPNLFRAQAVRPEVVEAEAGMIASLLLHEDALTRRQKELLMLVASAWDRNEYGVALWSETLKRAGMPLETCDQIVAGHASSPAANAETPLLDLAAKLVGGTEFGDSDIRRLREHPFSDRQILEAIATTALAKFLNTLQIGLGVAPDFVPRPVTWPSPQNNANLPAELPRPTDVSIPIDPDLETVNAVRSGNVDAFEQLIERHSRRVYRTLIGILGDPEDARDAMQDSFLKAFQHLDHFQGRAKFSTWLISIATNTGLQQLRERKPFESLDASPAETEETFRPREIRAWTEDPEQLYSQAERRQLIESSVMKLPTIYRVAVVLRDLEHLSTEDAAAALGLAVPTLKSRLLRGRLMLREDLAPHFTRRASEVAP
jgi:RNA polymerase sigma-70 factor (ECF subfamily)